MSIFSYPEIKMSKRSLFDSRYSDATIFEDTCCLCKFATT
uniref:Uncharacterized protein n=1 Tax=Arundo donax TaxID=35708 RepID=A0A0A9M5X8_ARUDO